jgi:hypothetical protein
MLAPELVAISRKCPIYRRFERVAESAKLYIQLEENTEVKVNFGELSTHWTSVRLRNSGTALL